MPSNPASPGRLLPLYIIILGFIFSTIKPLAGNDLAIYIKWGEAILNGDCTLSENPFNFTTGAEPVLNGVWLSEVIFYLLWSRGGWKLLQFTCGLLTALAPALLIPALRSGSGGKTIPVFAGTAFAFSLMLGNLGLRPQLLAIPLFAWFLSIIYNFRGRTEEYIAAFTLTALWVNLHGSFPLVLILTLLFFLSGIPDGKKGYLKRGGMGRRFILLGMVSLLASFVNPYGPSIYRYVLINSRLPEARGLTEWFPPTLNELTGKIFFISLFVLFFVFIMRGKRMEVREALLFLSFSFFALSGIRMVIWYGLALSPIFAALLSPLTEELRWKISYRLYPLILLFMVLLSILALPWVRGWLKGDGWEEFLSGETPVEISEFLEGEEGGRAFNLMEWGSFLILQNHPEFTFFVDPRIWLFSDRVWGDYLRISRAEIEWEMRLDEYGVDYLILNHETHRNLIPYAMNSPIWKEVYRDEKGVVFRRIPRKGRL